MIEPVVRVGADNTYLIIGRKDVGYEEIRDDASDRIVLFTESMGALSRLFFDMFEVTKAIRRFRSDAILGSAGLEKQTRIVYNPSSSISHN